MCVQKILLPDEQSIHTVKSINAFHLSAHFPYFGRKDRLTEIKIIHTILPVFYGCENWCHTLREEHRLWVFETRVLRGIFEPKRQKVAGSWRRLHNEKLHNLYASTNIVRMIKSRRMIWAGHVACIGKMKNSHKTFVGKPEGKGSLRRPRHKWRDIRMDETG
jgi:hypothetical protein